MINLVPEVEKAQNFSMAETLNVEINAPDAEIEIPAIRFETAAVEIELPYLKLERSASESETTAWEMDTPEGKGVGNLFALIVQTSWSGCNIL